MNSLHYQKVIEWIQRGSRVLDLGCGNGELIELLTTIKNIRGYGIEIQFENIVECTKRGISVFQGNIDEGLKEFTDQSFDYVIFSQTIQEVRRPLYVISEMLRVGKQVIIIFPNFAHWKIRIQLFLGALPKTSALPHDWFNTPNIRLVTIKDFKQLCIDNNIKIVREFPMIRSKWIQSIIGEKSSNLFSEEGMFIITKIS